MSDFIRTTTKNHENNFSFTKMSSNFLMTLIKISQAQLNESKTDTENDLTNKKNIQENNDFLVKIFDLIKKEYKCLDKKTTRIPLLTPCKKFCIFI